MALYTDCKKGMTNNETSEPAYAQRLFNDALTRILNEDSSGLHILRELITATIGFEKLAIKIGKPTQSVHRMLSDNGNPTFKNLMAILAAIRKSLNVQLEVNVIPLWKIREIEIQEQSRISGL